jgi:hypothetical protein
MVQMVVQRAREEAAAPVTQPTQLPELAGAYDTLMRTLRRTTLLVQKLATPPAPARTPPAPRPDSARKPARAADAPVDLANMSDEELDEAIEREERMERLEGLERPEDEDVFAGMSPEEVVRAILYGPEGAAWRGETTAKPGLTPARAGRPLHPPGSGAEGDATRPNGSKGCRDP